MFKKFRLFNDSIISRSKSKLWRYVLAARNPLQNYGDAADGSQCPRGGFPFTIIANPTGDGVNPRTAIVDVAFCEPIICSPFYWGKSNESGFYNINTMDFNFTFLSQTANRMWSHDDNAGTNIFTSSTFVFGGLPNGPTSFGFGNLPTILFEYITPQENMIIPANMPITYPYFDVLRFPTDLALNVAGSGPQFYQSNNIQLNSIPRRLYVYIRERNNDLYSNASHTDTYFTINNISLQFQNKNGLLASASQQQLYEMSVKNHCKMSWNQWQGRVNKPGLMVQANPADFSNQMGTIGSIVCIEFATDIGLDSLQAPGVLSQSMLQVQVTATNVSGRDINPTLLLFRFWKARLLFNL